LDAEVGSANRRSDYVIGTKEARYNAMVLLNLMIIGYLKHGAAEMDCNSFNRDLIAANSSNYAKV